MSALDFLKIASRHRTIITVAGMFLSLQPVGWMEDTPKPEMLLTLPAAVDIVLKRHPSALSAACDVDYAQAQAVQAGSIPNPEFEFEMDDLHKPESGSIIDESIFRVTLRQDIELGRKRKSRREAASDEIALAGLAKTTTELDLVMELKQAFARMLAAREFFRTADGFRTVVKKTRDTVAERVQAGRISPLELSKAEVEYRLSAQACESGRSEYRLESARLTAFLGFESNDPDRFEGSLIDWPIQELPDIQFLARNLAGSSEMTRLALQRRWLESNLEMERLNRIPDISLSAGVEFSNDTHEKAYSVGLAIPLPLFYNNRGGVGMATAELCKAEIATRYAATTQQTRLDEVYLKCQNARENVRMLVENILPLANESMSAAEEGYVIGKFSYLDLLDAQRTLYDVKRNYIAGLQEYHLAKFELERLVNITDLADFTDSKGNGSHE